MIPDDPRRDGQPEPGATLARREEQAEDLLFERLGDALATVPHLDRELPGSIRATGLDDDVAPRRRRIERIQDEVEECLA